MMTLQINGFRRSVFTLVGFVSMNWLKTRMHMHSFIKLHQTIWGLTDNMMTLQINGFRRSVFTLVGFVSMNWLKTCMRIHFFIKLHQTIWGLTDD